MTMTMTRICSNLNLEWFDHKDGCLIPKDGYQSMLVESLRAQNADAQNAPTQAAGQEVQSKPAVSLSTSQVKKLAQKYDPQNMSLKEYISFINELCELGVVGPEEKPYLCSDMSGENVLVLEGYSGPSVSVIPVSSWNMTPSFTGAFSSCSGNVLGWARYMATFQTLNPDTNRFEQSKGAALFEKVANILERVQRQRN